MLFFTGGWRPEQIKCASSELNTLPTIRGKPFQIIHGIIGKDDSLLFSGNDALKNFFAAIPDMFQVGNGLKQAGDLKTDFRNWS